MYKKTQPSKNLLKINTSYTGEPIEAKIRRIVSNKEPITDGAPLIYTDRKEGVQPDYNIRTDRWEAALDAMDKVSASKLAKREERHKTPEQLEADRIGKEAQANMNKEEGKA
ncbi:MAG: hypothetical protein [Microviridae sp.]|nr:MAG: hypothetical protein [Microviridae sp.]